MAVQRFNRTCVLIAGSARVEHPSIPNVIRLRFGLAGEEPKTLREAGSELGVSVAHARELERLGLRRLTGDAALEGPAEAA